MSSIFPDVRQIYANLPSIPPLSGKVNELFSEFHISNSFHASKLSSNRMLQGNSEIAQDMNFADFSEIAWNFLWKICKKV
jgi:hypothetical protein